MKHTLHIVTGTPGSGKTHYGKQLAKKLKAAFLDIDTCTETMVKAAHIALGEDPNDRDSPNFKNRFRDAIYSTQFDIAADNLNHIDIVVAGPFTKEIKRPDWHYELEERFSCPVKIYFTHCAPETTRKRIQARANPRDAAKLNNWDNYQSYFTQDSLPNCEHTLINTE